MMSETEHLTPRSKSNFILVRCPSCGNEQVVFDSAATVVKCAVCGEVLAEPSGGKAKIRGEALKILG